MLIGIPIFGPLKSSKMLISVAFTKYMFCSVESFNGYFS